MTQIISSSVLGNARDITRLRGLASPQLRLSRVGHSSLGQQRGGCCCQGDHSKAEFDTVTSGGLVEPASGKVTPCQIPTYTGISRDNSTCYLSQDIQV